MLTNVRWVHPGMLAHSAARAAQGSDRVRLVYVYECSILLAHPDNLLEVADGSLHAVDALHHHQDLLPGAVVPGLALDDRFAQDFLQVSRVVVAEHPDGSLSSSSAIHDGSVVQRVGDDQRLLAHEDGDRGGVRAVAHRIHDGTFFANKVCNCTLELLMDRVTSEVKSRRACAIRPLTNGVENLFLARVFPIVREAKVVVRP